MPDYVQRQVHFAWACFALRLRVISYYYYFSRFPSQLINQPPDIRHCDKRRQAQLSRQFSLNIFVEPSAGSANIASEYVRGAGHACRTRSTDVDVEKVSGLPNIKRALGALFALLTIFGTILPLDVKAYFHLEAALLIFAGTFSYVLLTNNEKKLATKIGDGAVFFGWLGLLFAWIYIAYNGFSEFDPQQLGVSIAYSMHPLLYGYVIKLLSLTFEI